MQNKLSRQLATVMFSDMVGYSQLMDEHEAMAIAYRNRMEEVLRDLTPKYDGKILQFYGDGAMSIFDSNLEAIQCASLIQELLRQDPIIPVRIGIHEGDIAFDEVNVYGDTVNIASRIESFAVPGSILFSERVNGDLHNHPGIKTRLLGEFVLKNIRQSIRLYALEDKHLITPSGHLLQGKGEAKKRSIAVLPFTNMSSDPENEYFSDGMSEEILNILSRDEVFKVTARTSSFAYKGKNLDIRQIGNELNVETVLEGSVRKIGNRVRVTAQLISTSDGYHLLSETYDRTLNDVFAVQDEIATRISNKLKERLGLIEEKISKEDKPTENMEAYQLYLKGIFHWNKYSPEEATLAIDFFQQALKLDPKFGKAWAYLSFCYSFLGASTNPKVLPHAEIAAQKAILLDDQLDIAHCAHGIVNLFYDWDLAAAEASLINAKMINPTNPIFHYTYSLFLKAAGRYAEAVEVLEKSIELDPFSYIANSYLADGYLCQQNYAKGLEQIEKTIEKFPDYTFNLILKGWLLVFSGKHEEAQAVISQKIDPNNPDFKNFICIRGFNFAKMGNEKRANGCVQRLKAMNAYPELAMVNYALGNKTESFDYLQKAVDNHHGGIIFMINHPHWAGLRKDPRFADLLKQMKIDDDYIVSEK